MILNRLHFSILLAILLFGISACGDDDDDNEQEGDYPSADTSVVDLNAAQITALCEVVRAEGSQEVECDEGFTRNCGDIDSCISQLEEFVAADRDECQADVDDFEVCWGTCECDPPEQCQQFVDCAQPSGTD